MRKRFLVEVVVSAGGGRVRIYDVASRAGVSVATTSKALNESCGGNAAVTERRGGLVTAAD